MFCSHLLHFRPDDDWSIQSKRWQLELTDNLFHHGSQLSYWVKTAGGSELRDIECPTSCIWSSAGLCPRPIPLYHLCWWSGIWNSPRGFWCCICWWHGPI